MEKTGVLADVRMAVLSLAMVGRSGRCNDIFQVIKSGSSYDE